MINPPLFALTFDKAKQTLEGLGMPAFRIRQIWNWVLSNQVFEFEKMTNLSKIDRQRLESSFSGVIPEPDKRLVDLDKTEKISFALADGNVIECVSLPDEESLTFCVSSQIGCPIGCGFCFTGRQGFTRNLLAHEIVLQYLVLTRFSRKKPTNLVFMGMGEPFLNQKEVFSAIDRLSDPKGINLGSRRITVSTVGIPDGIYALSERPGEVNLAVSLHSVIPEVRKNLVPGSKYSLKSIRTALEAYIARTNRRVTFEVVLLKGVNDGMQDALNLCQFCEDLLCHVNLLNLNSFPGCQYQPSSKEVVKEFRKHLKKAGIPVTIRKARGESILAACGQLAGK